MDNDFLVRAVASTYNYLGSGFRTERVLDAMRRVDRATFIPDKARVLTIVDEQVRLRLARGVGLVMKENVQPTIEDIQHIVMDAGEIVASARTVTVSQRALAYNDEAIPIGYHQTCSQPSMVAFMADALELKPGMAVLEIGTGCGYHAAVTAELLGEENRFYSVECLPELISVAEQNLHNHFGAGYRKRVKVIHADGSVGLPERAPFDAIYLTAGVRLDCFEPGVLAQQLKLPGGVLLYPEESGLMVKEVYGRFGNIQDIKLYQEVSFVPLKGENAESEYEIPALKSAQ